MQQGYYSAAWSDIKNSPGWFGKVCLMGLLSFVPVFGQMVCYGYSYGWARDIAWNVHRPMPERLLGNEDGNLYTRGIFSLLIVLILSVVAGLLMWLVGDSPIGSLVVSVIILFLSIVATVGIMRMAIYGRLSAGFQVKQIWKMTSHDFSGLLRILGMVVLVGLIISLVFTVAIFIPILVICFGIAFVLGSSVDSLLYGSVDPAAMASAAPIVVVGVLLTIAVIYAFSCACCWLTLLEARAYGYWTRQFDVASWGGQNDPLPFERVDAAVSTAPAAPAPVNFGGPAASAPESASVPQGAPSEPSVAPNAGESAEGAVEAPVAAQPVSEEAPQAEEAEGLVCPNCGAKAKPGAKFCVACGKKLEG